MTAMFAFFWFSALVTLAVTRLSSLSVLLMSSLVYSSPVFWTVTRNTDPALVWCIVLAMTILSQVYLERRSSLVVRDLGFLNKNDRFINLFFNISLLILFSGVIALSGGIGVFFEGKYGAIPGGSILIYYSWNSLLLLTCALNFGSRKLLSPFNVLCLTQIVLIFVGGDRTLPFLYVLIFIIYSLRGTRPIGLLRGRRAAYTIFFTLLVPILAVSKTIYTLLPEYGFTQETVSIVFGPNFWLLATKDFEPTHAHQILVHATSGQVDYYLSDLALGIFAFIPGSSAFGIEPHSFSLAVKSRYFTSWSDEAGIGAHFWAQGWVVGGILGVVIFCAGVIWILIFLEGVLSKHMASRMRALAVAQIVLFGFYVQRNSMEQILSFSGRYLVIFFLVVFGAYIVRNFLPKRQLVK